MDKNLHREEFYKLEEYITVSELSERIKLARQTIYNHISTGKFVEGKHYLKPSRKKILFKWSAIEKWLGCVDEQPCFNGNETTDQNIPLNCKSDKITQNLIKI